MKPTKPTKFITYRGLKSAWGESIMEDRATEFLECLGNGKSIVEIESEEEDDI